MCAFQAKSSTSCCSPVGPRLLIVMSQVTSDLPVSRVYLIIFGNVQLAN